MVSATGVPNVSKSAVLSKNQTIRPAVFVYQRQTLRPAPAGAGDRGALSKGSKFCLSLGSVSGSEMGGGRRGWISQTSGWKVFNEGLSADSGEGYKRRSQIV